jgi:hypothetical protein
MGRRFADNRVDSQFLKTMRMHLVHGRNFLPGEEGVVMITEAAARVLWRDEDALGKSLPWNAQGGAHGPTVVGVVANASTTVVGNPEPLEFYLPQLRSDALNSVLLLRVSGHPRDFVPRLQDAARALDGRLQPAAQVIIGRVRRRNEEYFPRTRGDRDPGFRGHCALGHRLGRPHRGTTHAQDRPADRARRSRRAGSANAMIWMPDSKTESGVAEMPLTEIAVEAFRNQIEAVGSSPFLFPNADNPTGYQASFKKVWAPTLRKACVPHFRIFDPPMQPG